MKVLLIIGSLRNGGAERVASNLSYSLEAKGYNLLVVTINKERIDYPVSNLIELGFELQNSIFSRLFNFVNKIFQIKKLKKSFKPNVSIGFMPSENLLNAITRSRNDLTISTIHNTLRFQENHFIAKFKLALTFFRSDCIVTVSRGIENELSVNYKLFKKKLHTINNYIRIDSEALFRSVSSLPVKLITIGRLEEQKSQWHLIRAVDQLRKTFPSITLTILGQGSLKPQLESLINQLGLEDHIYLLGFKNNVNKYLFDSDIFCLSSRNEGFAMVLIEAMNTGLPIVSTDIDHGPKEILNPKEINLYVNDEFPYNEKYGLLVDRGNNTYSNSLEYCDEYIVNQFTKKISLLIENSLLYKHYSAQSIKRSKDFLEESVINQWIALINEIK